MFGRKHFMTVDEKAAAIVAAATANDTRTLDRLLPAPDVWVVDSTFVTAAIALMKPEHASAFEHFAVFVASRVEKLDASAQTQIFAARLFGNAGIYEQGRREATPEMMRAVLRAAKAAQLGVDFALDQQLAFFMNFPRHDARAKAIAHMLLDEGADFTAAKNIMQGWNEHNARATARELAEIRQTFRRAVEKRKAEQRHGAESLKNADDIAQERTLRPRHNPLRKP